MKLRPGRVLGLVALLYTILATPWYLPRSLHPLVLGLPLWAFLTVLIVLVLGYVVYLITGKIEEVVSGG